MNKEGLFNIYNFQKRDAESVWVSTNQGLFIVDWEGNTLATYNEAQSNEFYFPASIEPAPPAAVPGGGLAVNNVFANQADVDYSSGCMQSVSSGLPVEMTYFHARAKNILLMATVAVFTNVGMSGQQQELATIDSNK